MLLVLMLDCTVFKTPLPSILLQLRNLIVWCVFFFQIFATSHYEGADLRLVSFPEGCVQGS